MEPENSVYAKNNKSPDLVNGCYRHAWWLLLVLKSMCLEIIPGPRVRIVHIRNIGQTNPLITKDIRPCLGKATEVF